MAKVTLEQLRKVYSANTRDAFVAVNDIDLEIRDQEFMVLVGPSGCGKSTTLRMIAGLEEISGGTCSIGDRVVNDVAPKERDIAMVFQNYALYPHMTVFDNMAFGLKLQGVPKREIEQRVQHASEILGIETLLQRKPKALSGGQRQRVAVGRAIVRQPKVFLFDEPLSNLDAKMRVSMRTEISKLHARLEATMIYVTHDQVEAMTMGDRICVMKDSLIMQVDEPLTLYREPRNMFVAGFIGSPPTNFLHGRIIEEAGRPVFEETNSQRPPVRITLDERLANKAERYLGKAIVFGIRPEAIADVDLDPEAGLTPTASAEVEVSEPMGAETFLYLHTGAHSIIAKVGASARYEPGREVRMHFALTYAHLFDPTTEEVI